MMMMTVMKVKEQNIHLLVDPKFAQLLHYGIDSVKVLCAPAVSISIRVRPGNRRTDHVQRNRTRNAGDGQPLPLLRVQQDVIHCREADGQNVSSTKTWTFNKILLRWLKINNIILTLVISHIHIINEVLYKIRC